MFDPAADHRLYPAVNLQKRSGPCFYSNTRSSAPFFFSRFFSFSVVSRMGIFVTEIYQKQITVFPFGVEFFCVDEYSNNEMKGSISCKSCSKKF